MTDTFTAGFAPGHAVGRVPSRARPPGAAAGLVTCGWRRRSRDLGADPRAVAPDTASAIARGMYGSHEWGTQPHPRGGRPLAPPPDAPLQPPVENGAEIPGRFTDAR